MKQTAKRRAAISLIRTSKDATLPTSHRASVTENADLYKQLESAGYRYDSTSETWQRARLTTSGQAVSTKSMFETSDGLGSGIIRLRLMAHPSDMEPLCRHQPDPRPCNRRREQQLCQSEGRRRASVYHGIVEARDGSGQAQKPRPRRQMKVK